MSTSLPSKPPSLPPSLPPLHSSIKEEDPLTKVFLVWPTRVLFGSLLIHLGNFFFTLPWSSILLGQAFLAIVEFVIFKIATVIVHPDKVAVRQFLSGKKLFTNCRIMHNRLFTQLVQIPSGQIIATTDKEGGRFVLTSQVKQTDDASLAGKSEKLFFLVKFVGRLAIRTNPEVVINAFFRKFRKSDTTDEALKLVTEEVLSIAIALADEALQEENVEELALSVVDANRKLHEKVEGKLAVIGFEIMQVTIEDMRDLVPGGYLSRLSEKTRAELQSQAQIATANAQQRAISATATADKEGRLMQANENQAAVVTEMAVRKIIAEQRLEALLAETSAEQQSKVLALQGLIEKMKVIDQNTKNVLLAKFVDMDDDKILDVAKQAAEKLGINVTGDLTIVASDGKTLTGMHAIAEFIKTIREMFTKS